MRYFFSLFFAFLLNAPATADTLFFETGSRYGERDLTWPGRVISLDPGTGLITFEYFNGSSPVQIEVHATRIYSITFDALVRINRTFPPTRRPLTEPLRSSLSQLGQAIELHNKGFLIDDLPADLRILNPEGPTATLRGAIVKWDGSIVTISGWNKSRSFQTFEIPADTLKSWIRGL